jgi:hypothetical protein
MRQSSELPANASIARQTKMIKRSWGMVLKKKKGVWRALYSSQRAWGA